MTLRPILAALTCVAACGGTTPSHPSSKKPAAAQKPAAVAPKLAAPSQPTRMMLPAAFPKQRLTLAQALDKATDVFAAVILGVDSSAKPGACHQRVALDVETELVLRVDSMGYGVHFDVLIGTDPTCKPPRSLHVGAGVRLALGHRYLFIVKGSHLRGIAPLDQVPGVMASLQPAAVPEQWQALPVLDSATARCSNGAKVVRCTPKTPPQDGTSRYRAPRFKVRGKVASERHTGVMWQRGASPTPLKANAATKYCADLALAGQDDWRLPTLYEMTAILDYGRQKPALNPKVFPKPKEGLAWLGTEDAGVPWVVGLAEGDMHSTHYDDPSPDGVYFARCVRTDSGPVRRATIVAPRGLRRKDVVDDPVGGLSWGRRFAGKPLTWADAVAHCQRATTAGHKDWRLPSIKELLYLGHHATGCVGDEAVWRVPDGQEDGVWSSTAGKGWAWRARSVCQVHFWPEATKEKYQVMCVRDLPPTKHTPGAPVVGRYPNGSAFASGSRRGDKRHGSWTWYHESGAPWFQQSFDDGVPSGPVSAWYANGQKTYSGTFAKGQLEGKVRLWDASGVVTAVGEVKAGKRHGLWVAYDDGGRKSAETRFDDGLRHGLEVGYDYGRKHSETVFVRGLEEGPAREFDAEEGWVTESGTYRKGHRHGTWRTYNKNGTVAEQALRVAGVITGAVTGQHPDGTKRVEGQFDNGVGFYKRYHPNGKLQSEQGIQGHRAHGTLRRFAPNGTKTYEVTYDRGRRKGVERAWWPNGKLREQTPYVDGHGAGVFKRWNKAGIKTAEGTLRAGRRVGTYREWDDKGRIQRRGQYSSSGRQDGTWTWHNDGKKVLETYWKDGEPAGDRKYFGN